MIERIKDDIFKFRTTLVSIIHKPKKRKRGLFIDGGSNIGQGYSFFKKYFPSLHFDVIFIEPNPNCMSVVKQKFKDLENANFMQKAIWIKEDKLKFFGLVEDDRGNISDGGSIVENHNSSTYLANKNQAIEVDAFSFSKLLMTKSKIYDKIIVKMDIESAEYVVLKDLVDKKAITCINHLFVEFHSQFFDESERPYYQKLEKDLIKSIKSNGVGVTLLN